MAASSCNSSSFLGACCAVRTAVKASCTRAFCLGALAASCALGNICDKSLCASSGFLKNESNNCANTSRSCCRLISTASSAAAKSSLRDTPTNIAASMAKAMRALSTGTPARRRARQKPIMLSAIFPVRASPNCMMKKSEASSSVRCEQFVHQGQQGGHIFALFEQNACGVLHHFGVELQGVE